MNPKRIEPARELWYSLGALVLLTFALSLLTCEPAPAAIRVDLLTRLDTKIQDGNNQMLDSTEKISILDEVGREMGRLGFYIKRDTILTVNGQEIYGFNTDYAGGLRGAYLKKNNTRIVLPVIDRETAFKLPKGDAGDISYVYIDADDSLGVEAIPIREDTIILLYFAYPAVLSGDSIEWDLPDGLEGAALDGAASKCWMTADLRPDMAELYYRRYRESLGLQEGQQ